MKTFLAFILSLALPLAAVAGTTNIPGRLILQTDDSAPTCSSATADGSLCIEGAVEAQSTLAVTGAATLASTLAVTGATTLTGGATLAGDVNLAGNELYGQLQLFEDITANDTMTVSDCGRVITTNDDNRVLTLPAVAAANKGCAITFVVTAADDAAKVSISPNASDGIFGLCCGVNDAATTACVALSGTDDKDLEDAKAEQNKGDNVTLVSDGSTGWYAVACVGAGWASES